MEEEMNRNKEFFKYVIPTIISFTLTGIYSIVDGFFVGNSIGDVGLSSINIAYPISALIQSFVRMGWSSGKLHGGTSSWIEYHWKYGLLLRS